MKTVVGIDEAGYGPTLGPLVLGLCAFRIHEEGPANLFVRFRHLIRQGMPDGERLGVDDSKRLFAGRRTLAPLELGALSFLQPEHPGPRRLEDLLGPADGETTAWPAWYRVNSPPEPLPLLADEAAVAGWRARLRRDLPDVGASLLECRVLPVLEGSFNSSLERTGNKAATLLEFLVPWLGALLRRHPAGDLELQIDRLGGRRYYGALLGTWFPFRSIRTLEEGPAASRYRVSDGARSVTLHFETGGDRTHLPVAVASMCAKYVRELYLRRLNAWFARRRPGLRPTAGYPTDAARFLREIEGLVGVAQRRELVRAR